MVGEHWYGLDEAIAASVDRLTALRASKVPTVSEDASATEADLERLEERQRDASVVLQAVRRDLAADESEIDRI